MAVAPDHWRASLEPARNLFTDAELWRLMWVEATLAAERVLVPPDEPCPDHRACRGVAFGLWLRRTGRISNGLEGEPSRQ
jgi:hypothetical protein